MIAEQVDKEPPPPASEDDEPEEEEELDEFAEFVDRYVLPNLR